MRDREQTLWSVMAVSERFRWRRLVRADMLRSPLHSIKPQ